MPTTDLLGKNTPAILRGHDDRSVRLGFIGVGLRGREHLRLALRRDDTKVVALCDIDPQALQSFRDQHPGTGASVTDVGEAAQVERLFDDLQSTLGGLDVLVNNAGIAGPTAPVEQIDPADWDRTIAVDLSGQFYCARLAVPLLKRSERGVIVNIASSAAFFGFPLRSPYVACKWASIGLTKTLAMELGPYGIRVNAVCPGSVSGERIEGVIRREATARGVEPRQVRETYLRQSSMRRFVTAAEVADLVVFLCSDQAGSISGQAIGLDGHTENLSQP